MICLLLQFFKNLRKAKRRYSVSGTRICITQRQVCLIQTPVSQEHTGHFLFPVCFKKKKRWGDHITDITQQLALLFNPFKDIWISFQVSEHWCHSCVFQRWLIIHGMCTLGFMFPFSEPSSYFQHGCHYRRGCYKILWVYFLMYGWWHHWFKGHEFEQT